MLFMSKVYLGIFPGKMLKGLIWHAWIKPDAQQRWFNRWDFMFFRYCDQICHPSFILPLLLETASLWGFLFPCTSFLICLQTNCLFFILWMSFIYLISRSLPCGFPSAAFHLLYNSSDPLHTNLDTSGKKDSQLRNFLHWIALWAYL